MNQKNKIIFCGTPKIGAKVLEAIFNKNQYDILFVISQPDKLIGRKKEVSNSAVKEFCLNNNIKIYQPNKIIELKEIILEAKPDLILTCAYGQFIPSVILDVPKYKCINVHASLLPKYRGGAPIHWSIINGEKETGISLMFMEKEMDSGNIIYQESFLITEDDNLETVLNKMENLAYKIISSEINKLFDINLKSIEQDSSKITFGYNIKREDERINWNNTSNNIHNLIRGLYKIPGAFTTLDNKIVKIYNSKILSSKSNSNSYGTIIDVTKDGMIVSTNDFDLLISLIQFESKNIINNNDIYNIKLRLINKRLI